jgi:hypothetical protein
MVVAWGMVAFYCTAPEPPRASLFIAHSSREIVWKPLERLKSAPQIEIRAGHEGCTAIMVRPDGGPEFACRF